MRVVFLYGPVAAGKHTVGRLLAEQADLVLFHNHLAVDLATELFPFGSEGFRRVRAEVWATGFRALLAAGRSFAFTFSPEETVSQETVDGLVSLVHDAGASLLVVELRASPEAVRARLASPSRAAFGKLQDADLYDQLLRNGVFDAPRPPPADLLLDTELLSPEEAAARVLAALSA